MFHIPTNVGEKRGNFMLDKEREEIFSVEDTKILKEVFDEYLEQECSNVKIIEDYEFSNKFKRRINRIFRDRLNNKNIPHKKQDNLYERFRSRMIALLKKR